MLEINNEKENNLLFVATVFLTLPSFFRLNGIILFPIEIIVLAGYVIFSYKQKLKIIKLLVLLPAKKKNGIK